jgi:hypothetical protein
MAQGSAQGKSSQAISSTATVNKVVAAATPTTLLAANTLRKQYKIFNDSTSVNLYVLEGVGTVSLTNYTYSVLAGGYYETSTTFTGAVTGLWASATGFAMVTELT